MSFVLIILVSMTLLWFNFCVIINSAFDYRKAIYRISKKNVAYICSIIVDICIMVIGLSFLVNLGLQILSLLRLIQFLATSKWMKTALILSIIILSQLYILDIFLMLSPLWGAPAYNFTNNFDKMKIQLFWIKILL